MTETWPLAALLLDEELQPRAAIDRTVLENYVQLLVDGVRFPPVVAFRDDQGPIKVNVLWLADGFRRWHAHKVIEADGIEVDVRTGTRRDALLYSLAANAKHGLQRGATDYKRAYEIACRHELLTDPADVEAVAALLRCSGRWAEKLTEKAREADKAERDAKIVQLKGEGKTHQEVADAVGVSPRTVATVQKTNSAETARTAPANPNQAAREQLAELASPEAQAWSAALRALRQINEQLSVEELFDARYMGFDRSFGPALDDAFAWITELHRRFGDERDRRRRA